MGNTVRITTDNKVSVIDITPFDRDGWYEAIGCGCDIIERVHTQIMFDLFKMPLLMIVDEEFYSRGQLSNSAASQLYCKSFPYNTIRGNVIFAVPDGEDMLPLSEEDAEMIKDKLMEKFTFLEEEK